MEVTEAIVPPGKHQGEARQEPELCASDSNSRDQPGPRGEVVSGQPSHVSTDQTSPGLRRLGEDLAGLTSQEEFDLNRVPGGLGWECG